MPGIQDILMMLGRGLGGQRIPGMIDESGAMGGSAQIPGMGQGMPPGAPGSNQIPGMPGMPTSQQLSDQLMKNPAKIGGYTGLAHKLNMGLGRLTNAIMPVDPRVAQGMDPQYLQQLRQQAMLKTGLGMMSAANQGGRFGESLMAGYGAGLGGFNESVGNAYQVGRQDRADQRLIARQGIEDSRYADEMSYKRGRDLISDEQKARDDAETKRYHDEYLKMMREKAASGGGDMGTVEDTYKDPRTRRRAALSLMSDPTKIRELASFGKEGQYIRNIMQQEMTKIQDETGMSDADFLAARARSMMQTSNLGTLAKQQSQFAIADKLARANGDRVLELISKMSKDETGVPILDGWRRTIARGGAGAVDEAELKSVLSTFQMETARILNGHPEMRGVISDSLRHEIEAMTPQNMTAEQAQRVIKRLYTEMDIKQQAIEEQMSAGIQQKQLGLGQGQQGGGALDFSAWLGGQQQPAATAPRPRVPENRVIDVPF